MKNKCPNVAVVKRYWPGREPDRVCIEHAEDSKRIADAIGFYLVLEPLSYDVNATITDEILTCCCSPGFSQKISCDV